MHFHTRSFPHFLSHLARDPHHLSMHLSEFHTDPSHLSAPASYCTSPSIACLLKTLDRPDSGPLLAITTLITSDSTYLPRAFCCHPTWPTRICDDVIAIGLNETWQAKYNYRHQLKMATPTKVSKKRSNFRIRQF